MRENENLLTAETVRELLIYNPKTGNFRWRRKKDGRKRHTARWAGKSAGCVRPDGYASISINGHRYFSHRLAWFLVHGEWPPEWINHIDGDRANNRIDNLRLATRQESLRNRKQHKNNTTGVTGVHWHKRYKKFLGRVKVDGKIIHLGTFDTIEEAAAARAAAETEHFGEFRRNA